VLTHCFQIIFYFSGKFLQRGSILEIQLLDIIDNWVLRDNT